MLHVSYNINKQIEEYRKQIEVPAIQHTPGKFEGVQFKFTDLLKDAIKQEVYKCAFFKT